MTTTLTERTAPSPSPAASAPVLQVSGVTLRFGGLVSLRTVDLTVRRGEIHAVIGPNGAGKTSLFNSLTGAYTPQEGRVLLRTDAGREHSLLGRKPHQVNRLGVARTFQNIRLFSALTALENVKVAAESGTRSGPLGIVLGLPRAKAEERAAEETARRLLALVGLEDRAEERADSLSYGDQRRLEIARALATGPRLLLLDEPAAGTNPTEKRQLAGLIRRINHELDISVLLIEHDMPLVTSVADRVTVLNFGKVIASGPPSEVQRDPAVVEAYLGTPDTDSRQGRTR
ncbi:ABC transporter ATP-binding protein [Streptomyces sp. NPDC001193]